MQAKFERIAARLRADIDAGVYTERLPSELNLARQLGTTTNTLRKAQALLIAEGRLVKRRPQGTFITQPTRPTIRVSLLMPLFAANVIDDIASQFRSHFPDVDVKFHGRNEPGIPPAECDLIGIPNLSPIPFHMLATPFPSESIAGLPLEHYFEQAFEVHRTKGLYYGLPLLFSPTVLMGNRSILDAEGFAIDPHDLDASTLVAMAAVARKRKMTLWHQATAERILRSLVFVPAAEPGVLRSVDKASLARLLRRWASLFTPDVIGRGEDLSYRGGNLLMCSCRQAMNYYHQDNPRVYAWPREVRRCTGVSGEFLLLNRHSAHRDAAIRVALHFLSPQVQGILGRNGIGVPVLKSAAVDGLGMNPWRDDLFLSEVRHICANSAREHEFLQRLALLSRDLFDACLSMNDFIRLVQGEIDLARRRRELGVLFMTAIAERAGEAAVMLG